MIIQKQSLTSTKNIFAVIAFLLCTSHIHPMITTGTIALKQPRKIQLIRTFTQNNYSSYEQAKKIGDKNCSEACEKGTCYNNKLAYNCCKNLYDMPNTDSKDKWASAEATNKIRRNHILREIDRESNYNRTAFIKKINQDIEALSSINHKAYWEYLYNGDIIGYKKICKFIDHKHHCLLNQLRVIENDIHNLWKECQTFTIPQLQTDPTKRQNIVDLLTLCKQEPVELLSFRLLNAQVDRDRIISKPIETPTFIC